MLDLGVLAISTYISDHYMEISEENYFLLDSLKKQMVEHKNKLKCTPRIDHDCRENIIHILCDKACDVCNFDGNEAECPIIKNGVCTVCGKVIEG